MKTILLILLIAFGMGAMAQIDSSFYLSDSVTIEWNSQEDIYDVRDYIIIGIDTFYYSREELELWLKQPQPNYKLKVNTNWSPYNDTVKPIKINLYDIPITIGDIFEYEKECHKDTTMIVGWKIIKDTLDIETYDSSIYIMTYQEPIYQFRDEPTFKDFIKWIKTK